MNGTSNYLDWDMDSLDTLNTELSDWKRIMSITDHLLSKFGMSQLKEYFGVSRYPMNIILVDYLMGIQQSEMYQCLMYGRLVQDFRECVQMFFRTPHFAIFHIVRSLDTYYSFTDLESFRKVHERKMKQAKPDEDTSSTKPGFFRWIWKQFKFFCCCQKF